MQKKIIALAIAGLASTAAFAQSNVTVYGVVDMGYARLAGLSNTKTVNAIESGLLGGSRIGFKGTEDLGNGLKAIFTLEYALAVDANSGVGTTQQLGDTGASTYSSSASRQAFAGVTGGFGTVVAGRLQTAGYDWAAAYSPVAGSAIDTVGKLKAATLLAAGSGGRADNAVAYISPSFSGFTVAVNHARLTEGSLSVVANQSDSYANLIGADYTNGPIKAGLVYAKISRPGTVASDDVKELGIGGSYDFGVAKLFASYQTKKDEAGVGGKDKKWQLGVTAPVGPGVIAASYAQNKLDNNAVSSDKGKSYVLAYLYPMSKRTTLYTGYNVVNNETNSVAGLGTSYVPVAGTGDNVKVFGAGVNHKF